jgi:hypothetical protein
MRRKKSISPEKPVQDLVEYRFKILLLPFISISVAIFILAVFIVDFIELTTGNIAKIATFDLMHWSSYILLLYPISLALLAKIHDNVFVFTSDEISGLNLWLRRTCINWDRIAAVKSYQVMGMRYLSIKAIDGENIHLATHLYKTSQILDRVRELAGEDHILVRALEKELSRPRYELTKLWCWTIGSIVLTISIYLIGGNMYAAEQEKPLEQAIASYVRQHPKTAPNQSAIELQALMTKLGLSIEVFGDGSEVKIKPDKAAISEWKAIEPIFRTYLHKQTAVKESSEPVPAKLSTYLKVHQADLDVIETHLMNNPLPQWGSDSGWIAKSDPKAGDSLSSKMNFLAPTQIEYLMIVNVIKKQQLPNVEISKDLAGIERIQQSIQSNPSFLLQRMSISRELNIAQLVRKVDRIPSEWGDSLFSPDRHKKMLSAIKRQSMIILRVFQSPTAINDLLRENNNPLQFIPGYYYLMRPHIRLSAIDWYDKVQQGIGYWGKQNICRTDGKIDAIFWRSVLASDSYSLSPALLPNHYSEVLKSDLRWEETSTIRQVKTKLAAGEKVDQVVQEFNIPSKVCPGEQWTAKANDGNITIEFSHPPNWQALGIHPDNIDPLTYTIKLIE